MNLEPETRDLAMFMGTLVAIVLLSKIGGNGADLAIMTGLIGVLGMIVGQKRSSTRIQQPKDEPIPVEEQKP